MKTKRCPKCKTEKELPEFWRKKSHNDGLQCWCKPCVIEGNRRYSLTKAGKEARKRNNKEYQQTETGKKANREGQKKYQKANPEKIKAHNVVNNAVAVGRLKKEPCRCGEIKVEVHHEDYSKPFNVEWLCTKHHKELHRLETKNEGIRPVLDKLFKNVEMDFGEFTGGVFRKTK